MQPGDIKVQISLRGEPQKLLTYWRGSLRETVPDLASVTILRKRKARPNWWSWDDPNFYFEQMNRSENKRAELSVSEKSLHLNASEIAIARELTTKLFDWLRQRQGIPDIQSALPDARISLTIVGGLELIDFVEAVTDSEVLFAAIVGAVYMQNAPRHPVVRWLPEIKGTDKTVALGELVYFEKNLADGQADEVRRTVDRIAAVFRKSVAKRRAHLNKRFSEVFGYGAKLELDGRPISDDMVEGFQYDYILQHLDAEQNKKPKDSIRAWRA